MTFSRTFTFFTVCLCLFIKRQCPLGLFSSLDTVLCFVCHSLSSSWDELQSQTEWIVPSPAAVAHSRVPAHEDAQEDPGTPVVCVLCYIRQDRTTHLYGKGCSVCVNVSIALCVCCVVQEAPLEVTLHLSVPSVFVAYDFGTSSLTMLLYVLYQFW